jgi:RecA/RadA recombinase
MCIGYIVNTTTGFMYHNIGQKALTKSATCREKVDSGEKFSDKGVLDVGPHPRVRYLKNTNKALKEQIECEINAPPVNNGREKMDDPVEMWRFVRAESE